MRRDVGAERGDDVDADRAEKRVAGRRELQKASPLVERSPSLADQRVAALRDDDPVRRALEELDAERVLELLDLRGERWLRDVAARSRAAEVFFLGDGDGVFQVAKRQTVKKHGKVRAVAIAGAYHRRPPPSRLVLRMLGMPAMLQCFPKSKRKTMAIVLYELCGRDPAQIFSPHCWKVRMALAHKGLAYESRPTPFTKISAIANGFSNTVPVIDDDGELIRESFDIALHLERKYPDRPTLFGGPGGEAIARFVERWTQFVVQAALLRLIVADINSVLGDEDQAYFRPSREARLGKSLEEVQSGREDRLEAFRHELRPLREMLAMQPFVGGQSPLFPDYVVFGALQWARVASPLQVLADDDPVADWFERLLDAYGGVGRATAAAA